MMKVEVYEFDNYFSVSLVAETSEEATVLVRLAMNWKKRTPSIVTHAAKARYVKGQGDIAAKIKTYIDIRKLQEDTQCIQRVS